MHEIIDGHRNIATPDIHTARNIRNN
jgi:hypothetical protein